MWRDVLSPVLQASVTGEAYDDYYFELIVRGSRLLGSCSSWCAVMEDAKAAAATSSIVEINFVTGLHDHIMSTDESNFDRFVCKNISDFERFFLEDLIGDSAVCNETEPAPRSMMIKRCAEQIVSVCVGCGDPCDATRLDSAENFFLSPCALAPPRDLERTFVNMFMTKFLTEPSQWPIPEISSVTFSTSSNSVSVNVSATEDGLMYCGLFAEGINRSLLLTNDVCM